MIQHNLDQVLTCCNCESIIFRPLLKKKIVVC